MNADHALHPAMNLMVADLLARAGAAPPAGKPGTRLYLSYHAWQGGRFSTLDNEAEVAEVPARLGFRTLQPWRMSLADQLTAYTGAECVVCEAGAAACNALFVPRGASVVTFGAPDVLHSRICALRGQTLAVVEPEGGFAQGGRARIDPAGLAAFLDRLPVAAASPVLSRRIVAAPPPPAPGITTLPPGPPLAALEAEGHVSRSAFFAEAQQLARVAFFHAEPIDPAVAPFGKLFTDPAYRSYTAARMQCVALSGASVIGASGLVAVGERLLQDSMHSIDAWRPESVVAAIDFGQGARFKRPLRLPGQALPGTWFCAVSGGWRNYAHWLTETLPRLYLFRLLRGVLPDLQLLVPDFGASPAHARTLELLGIGGPFVRRLADDEVVAPETLWCAPGIDVWNLPVLCRTAAQSLVVALPAEAAGGAPAERVYISRQGSIRHVANFAAIAPVLEAFGFTVLAMETLTLDQQIRAMQHARYVVGEHGAGVANIMFCRPGARLLELFNPAGAQPAHWALASLCGLDYGYLVGRHAPAPHASEPDGNADYTIDPDQLAAGLRAMGA